MLENSNFSDAKFTDTNFISTYLANSIFTNSTVNATQFDKCTIPKSNFNQTRISNASFTNCNLENSELNKTKISECSFYLTNLNGVSFIDSNISTTNFEFNKFDLYNSTDQILTKNFGDVNLCGANLLNCNFDYICANYMNKIEFADWSFHSEVLKVARIKNCDFINSHIYSAIHYGENRVTKEEIFIDCNFTDCVLDIAETHTWNSKFYDVSSITNGIFVNCSATNVTFE